MIFRNFLAWAQTAPAASRIQGASLLARAFLESDLSEEDRGDAEVAMTALLDDPAMDVRRTLAIELAASPLAPRHIISALATDQSYVSIPVLSRSPLLGDGELVDCVAVADVYAQAAIALRPGLSEAVAWTIADIGSREAVISLAVNSSAEATETVLRRALERFSDDGEVRESLLLRGGLPAGLLSDLVSATSSALGRFVTDCGWLSSQRADRTCREARESGLVEIAASGTDGAGGLAHHLREKEQLTPALLLRALLSGNRSLLEAALSELSGLPADRVAGFVAAWSGAGFAAIYAKAGLPAGLLPVFRAALAAQDQYGLVYASGRRPVLSRLLIDGALRALGEMAGPDIGRAVALLQRLRAEAARMEARALSHELVASLSAPPVEIGTVPPVQIDLAAIEAEIAAAA